MKNQLASLVEINGFDVQKKAEAQPSKLANPIKLDSLLRNMYTGLCTFAKHAVVW